MDSRAGEDWVVYSGNGAQHAQHAEQQHPGLTSLYDGAASWWTQSCRGDLQTEVSRAVAAAAGRYMHVFWPEIVHEPGLRLTQRLLSGPLGAGWASWVFFSDNGSTSVEVAVKMALRWYQVAHGLAELGDGQVPRLEVRARCGVVVRCGLWGGVRGAGQGGFVMRCGLVGRCGVGQ